eukprot:TCONS_00069616-protein
MELSLENAAKVFQDASIPMIDSVFVDQSEEGKATFRLIWQQNDHAALQKKNFSTSYKLDTEKSEFESIGFPSDLSNEILLETVSKSKEKRAVIKKSTKQNTQCYFLEVWSMSRLIKTVDLSAHAKHGIVHADLFFSSFTWDQKEEKLLYVAEKKKPRSRGFFEQGEASLETNIGNQYDYEESWGEMLYDIITPTICIFDVPSETLYTLEHEDLESYSLAQPQWGPNNSIVVCGYKKEPFRLGKFYCENRESNIFVLEYDSEFKVQSAQNITKNIVQGKSNNWCPRVNNSFEKFVFMHCPLAEEGNPHGTDSVIYTCDFSSKKLSKVELEPMFITNFPSQIWFDDNLHIAFQIKRDGLSHIVVVNTVSGNVMKSDNQCFRLFGVVNSFAIWCSSILGMNEMVLVLYEHKASEGTFVRHQVKPLEFTMKTDYSKILLRDIPNICSWVVYPRNSSAEKMPLIVWAHGGPHTVFTIDYDPLVTAFCQLGFAVLLVNYTGSTSFSKKSLLELPGKIGSRDVIEVQAMVTACIAKFKGRLDENNVFYFGGSHGGFLGAHLMGQYPDFYRAAAIRNPVIEISSMSLLSDIPDWSYFESGLEYNQGKIPTEADFSTMLGKSPIVNVGKIKNPILIFVGEKDARVPPSQGKAFYRVLKGNGKTVKLISYPEGSHPLKNVKVQGDFFMNTVKWFFGYYKH